MGLSISRRSLFVGLSSLLLVACGEPKQESSPGQSQQTEVLSPMAEASKLETEGLLIYGNIAEYNWRPVLDAFNEKYPWIKVEISDIGPSASFERYYSENSVGKHTADIIGSAAPDAWQRFADRGQALEYISPEASALPAWSMPNPGVYTISTDPMIIVYNKLTVPEADAPRTLADLARLAESQEDQYRDKMTTYSAPSHSFGYDIHWAVMRHLGEEAGQNFFRAAGAVTRPESGGATMVEKLTSGEYSVGYFVSGITIFPRMGQAGRKKIIGWNLIEDGTPIFYRNIGITKATRSPNSAKLLLDFVLSHEGQVEVGRGGLTPFRPDVTKEETEFLTYQSIVDEIGEENIVHVSYDPTSYEHRDDFLKFWNKAYRLE